MGPPAFPCLATALADTNQPFRAEIATYLVINMAPDVGTNACLIPLRAALNDPEFETRDLAEAIITMLTNAPAH